MRNELEDYLKIYLKLLTDEISELEARIPELKTKIQKYESELRGIPSGDYKKLETILGGAFAVLGFALLLIGNPTTNTFGFLSLLTSFGSVAAVEKVKESFDNEVSELSHKIKKVDDLKAKADLEMRRGNNRRKQTVHAINNMPLLIHGKRINNDIELFVKNFANLLDRGLSVETIIYTFYEGNLNELINSLEECNSYVSKQKIMKLNEKTDRYLTEKNAMLKPSTKHEEEKQKVESIRKRRSQKYRDLDEQKSHKI